MLPVLTAAADRGLGHSPVRDTPSGHMASKSRKAAHGLLDPNTECFGMSAISMPDHLSTTFSALANPTRRSILARLASGDAYASELAEPFDMSRSAISQHLGVLERAGLIERGRNAQWRLCRLKAAPLYEVAAWVAHYQRFWDQSLDCLYEYVSDGKRARTTITAVSDAKNSTTQERMKP